MTTREAARPLRRYMRARVRAASLAPTYTITRDVTELARIPRLFRTARLRPNHLECRRDFEKSTGR